MTETPKLSERVEAATGPDRELDAEIAVAVSGDVGAIVVPPYERFLFSHKPGWWRDGTNKSHSAPSYTASLDAALTLMPSDAFWRLGHDGDGADPSEFRAQVLVPTLGSIDAHGAAFAATPALALCAAALKARGL